MNATAPDVPLPVPARPLPTGTAAAAAAAEFDAFYQAHYPDLVAMTYALTGEFDEAQDLVQEAFCRAWRRWDAVTTYDNPVAWVRRVTVNLAMSRWRRLKVAGKHLRRERLTDVPPLEPDHVAIVAALRTLPPDQRRALVLHHLLDLPVDQVAHELGAPVGTVKSWLHRGRTAMSARLGDAFEGVTEHG